MSEVTIITFANQKGGVGKTVCQLSGKPRQENHRY